VYTGENHTISATVTGGFLPLDQQWTKGGADLTGETGTSYAITSAGPGDVAEYALRVQDNNGTTRSSASTQVLVADHLQITEDPVGADKVVDSSYTFIVGVSGGFSPINYQWKREGTDVDGATESQLTISPIQASDEGNYTAEVRDAGGELRTSQAALLHIVGPLAILKSP
jgi:hypothetical protein